MDDSLQAARDAFQRFQALALQFRETHAAWQEAVRVGSHARQTALIARERDILTAVCEVMTAFQAALAACHWERDAAGESPQGRRETPAQGRRCARLPARRLGEEPEASGAERVSPA